MKHVPGYTFAAVVAGKTRTIHQNRYGNWRCYESNRFIGEAGTREDVAREWLNGGTLPNPADTELHAFSTFMGIVPDSDDAPLCGATLTSNYNGRNAPKCKECLRLWDIAKKNQGK